MNQDIKENLIKSKSRIDYRTRNKNETKTI